MGDMRKEDSNTLVDFLCCILVPWYDLPLVQLLDVGAGLWLKPQQSHPSSSEMVLRGPGEMLAGQWVLLGKDSEFKIMTVTCVQGKSPVLCRDAEVREQCSRMDITQTTSTPCMLPPAIDFLSDLLRSYGAVCCCNRRP